MMQFFRKNVRAIMLVIVVAFIVSIFAMYGVDRGGRSADSTSGESGERDYAVATVNGENIMRSRIEADMYERIRSMGAAADGISEDVYPAIRSMLLDELAVVSELDKEVNARNIVVTKEEIDETIRGIESTFPTREIYLQQMQQAGMDEAKFREIIEEQLKRQKLVDQVTATISTDEQELRTFYEMMKLYAFQMPAGFMMSMAHFGTRDAAEAARTEIQNGRSWSEVIADASADVINQIPFESPVLIEAEGLTGDVEFLKEHPLNTVSPVVELASDDFMLVVKHSEQEARTAEFDEVSADVREVILGQRRQAQYSQFLQELRARAVVEILDPSIFSAPTPPMEEISGDAAVTSEEPTAMDGSAADTSAPAEEPADQEAAGPASTDAEPAQPEATETIATPEPAGDAALTPPTSEETMTVSEDAVSEATESAVADAQDAPAEPEGVVAEPAVVSADALEQEGVSQDL